MKRTIAAACGLVLLCSTGVAAVRQEGTDPFEVQVQALGDGVYLAYRPDPVRVPVEGNVLLIVNDDDVVVVDAGGNPVSARRIIDNLRRITDKPVRYLVNTHWHGDHTVGNAAWVDAYPGLEVVGHQTLLEDFRAGELQYVADTAADPESQRQTYRDAISDGREYDPKVAEWLRRYYEEDLFTLADAYRGVRLEPPSLTLQDGLRWVRGDRVIEVRHLGFGDTRNDVVVYLPGERIVATGDMLTFPIPFGYTASPLSMLETLRRLEALDVDRLVPGHGPVLEGKDYLRRVIELFDSTIQAVRGCVAAGLDENETRESVDLKEQEALFTGGDPLLAHLFDRWLRRPLVGGIYRELTDASGSDIGTADAAGGALPRAEPSAVGFSAERLARIGSIFDEHVAQSHLAGAVTLIARRGRIVHLQAHGLMDTETGTPMRTDAIFRIASMSKTVTAVAVLMLYEEGQILLTEPISTYLPEFHDLEVAVADPSGGDGFHTEAAAGEITVRDLLRHTSGITYASPEFLGRLYRESGLRSGELSAAEFARRLADLPLADQPGTRWRYGMSFDVLGRLIEAISGQPLDLFFEQRIFAPLGMVDTGFFVPADKLDRLASVYEATDGGLALIEDAVVTSFDEPPRAFSGGGGWGARYEGGLVSSAEDYARLLQMLLNGGSLDGRRLLGRKSVELMATDHLGDIPGPWPGVGFGLGVAVLTDPGQLGELGSKGMFWWGGAASTYFWVDPEEEMIGVFMTQLFPRAYLRMDEQFQTLAYQALID
jgi:CubicO group peptidase (beta-lactamase class C family)/glyoxylase-like metal-dependent hydrolase (beta-lactamase superfamily II)